MDDPRLPAAEHELALHGLARLNRAAGIERTVYRALRPLLSGGPVRVLDVAAGSGDLIAALARRTAGAGHRARFTGCDISEFACQRILDRAAGLPAPVAARIDATRCDVLSEPLPQGYDIVMCHLFLHHLAEPDIVRVLGAMRASARRAVIITDLRRTPAGYALARLASRVLTRSPVVRADALLSVRAALTVDELRELAGSAGYDQACIRTVWPQRFLLVWRA